MATAFMYLIIALLAGAVLYKARQYGEGNLWLGLKRYFDPDYQTDADQNKDIEHGLFLLSQRLDAYSPNGWTLELQQGNPDRPPPVRFVKSGGQYAGVYLYDSPAELLQKWSLPAKKEG